LNGVFSHQVSYSVIGTNGLIFATLIALWKLGLC